MTEAEKIARILLAEPKWRVVCHVKPDGDTLGCGSALVSAGKKLGRNVIWGGVDPLPPLYAFLPHSGEYRTDASASDGGRCVIAVDVSARDRGVPGLEPRISIDHHESNERFGAEVNWIDPQAAATGEMIYEVILALGCAIDTDIAEALYVSIATDCGWFRFSNTTADTMRVAAELIRAGAVPVKMDERLHFNDTPAKLRLWGRCMARVETVGARAALSWITRDDFRETGALESDTEGLINMLTHIKGADVTVMISEVKDCLRCSVRSRGPVSAQAIAAKWNGGGHRYAAGCKIYLPLEEGLKALEEELSRV